MTTRTRRSRSDETAGVAFAGPVRLDALARSFGGLLDPGLEGAVVLRVAPIASAGSDDLAPFTSRRFLASAKASSAVLLVQGALAELVPVGRRWVHSHAGFALARLLEGLAPPPPNDARAFAHVDPRAIVDSTASLGPGVVVLAGAEIGAHTRVEPNAVIYGGARVGARVVIGAGAVIGRAGFGWAASPEGPPVRVPQLGGVRIEDDVEIGALATIDAGTLGPTVVERGAKLDAMVHVAHNARIGAHSFIAAQAGFAGSVEIGSGVQVGGQAGVADHVVVGDGARLAAKAGVIGDVPPQTTVAGYPAVDRARWLRAMARALREPKRGR